MPVPFDDARRALRWVRANANVYKLDRTRVGMAGFSAGGHLAALTSPWPVAGDPQARDPVDREGSRPDFVILGYPALNMFWADDNAILLPRLDLGRVYG